MNNSESVKNAILEAHIGKEVTAIIGDGQMSIFSGVLQKECFGGSVYCWVLVSERAMAHQQGAPVVVPETKIFFTTEGLRHLVVRQETADEAKAKMQDDQRRLSIVDQRGKVVQ